MKQQENAISFDFTSNPKKHNLKSDLLKLVIRPIMILSPLFLITIVTMSLYNNNFVYNHNNQAVPNTITDSSSLNSIHQLKIDSQNLVNTVFNLNKNSYKQDLYNLESNKILTLSGYEAILSLLSKSHYIDKLNNDYVFSANTKSQDYPYVDKTAVTRDFETMEIVVPFILIENKNNTSIENSKEVRLLFQKINNQFLLIDMQLEKDSKNNVIDLAG